ncbi:MAG: DUF2802 domain-containing protein [Formivibrio sp.]|nr:DUF2802 domain-containing protein [Formivibrio sp.]
MNGIVITWPQLLYISLVLILFYAAELLLFLRKSSQRKSRSPSEHRDLLEQQEQIIELRREVETLKVRLAALHAQQAPLAALSLEMTQLEDDTPYSQAIRLAQQGADAEKVSATCGISRGEADLIVALYRSGTPH